jgi:hypothetical protein
MVYHMCTTCEAGKRECAQRVKLVRGNWRATRARSLAALRARHGYFEI